MGMFDDLMPGAPAGAGMFDDLPPKESSSILRTGIADKALGFASGAVGATKALSDAVGAGNAVSGALDNANKGITGYLSPEAQADQQKQSAIMDAAKGQGVWEGVKAAGKAFAVAPVQTSIQGLGSIVPVLAGGLAGLPGAALTGAAMGLGTAKGTIFDDIKQRSLAKGMSEADATAAATQAQNYDGGNLDQIGLGGALGAADALTGVSRVAGSMLRGAIGNPVKAIAADAVERGVLARAGMGMLGEMPLEAAQGGQEQLAANVAAQRAGHAVDTWEGVPAKAAFEALASAGPGAAFGAMNRAPRLPATTQPDTAPDTAPPLPVDNVAAPEVPRADGQGTTPIDPTIGPLSAAAASHLETNPQAANRANGPLRNYPTRVDAQDALDQREDGARMDIIQHPRGKSGFAVVPKSQSDIADIESQQAKQPDAKTVEDTAPVTPAAPAEQAYSEIQPGDILTKVTKRPFTDMDMAMRVLARAGEGHEIVRVKDGLVIRPTSAQQSLMPEDQNASGNDGRGAGDNPAPVQSGAVGEPRQLPSEVPDGAVTWDNIKPGQQVTLYRGESAANDKGGQWWTTDKAKAERYGNVTAVTLPSETVGKHSVRGHNGADEFVFPTESNRPNVLAEKAAREASSVATSGYDSEKKIRFATFAESLAGQDAKTIQAALAKSEFGQSLAGNELEQVSKAIAANAPVVADQARKNAAPQKESTLEQKLKNQLVFAQERVKIAEKAVSDAVDTDKFGFPAADGPKKQAAIKRHEAAKKTLVDLESQLGALNTNVQNNTPAANEPKAQAAPDQTTEAMAGDAAATADVPGAGSTAVQADGVKAEPWQMTYGQYLDTFDAEGREWEGLRASEHRVSVSKAVKEGRMSPDSASMMGYPDIANDARRANIPGKLAKIVSAARGVSDAAIDGAQNNDIKATTTELKKLFGSAALKDKDIAKLMDRFGPLLSQYGLSMQIGPDFNPTGNVAHFASIRGKVAAVIENTYREVLTKAPTSQPTQPTTGEGAGVSPSEDKKAKWLKAINDQNRLMPVGGVQLTVQNGKLTFMGNPDSSKQGKALQATLAEAQKAGASVAEIIASIQAPAPKKTLADAIAKRKEAKKATGTEVATTTANKSPALTRPNIVIRDVRGFNGEKLGDIIEPHDGTKAGILAAAERTNVRLQDEYPDATHAGSRTGATDENGAPKWAISPNGQNIAPFDTKEGAYIFGDLSAAPTPQEQSSVKTPKAIEASPPAQTSQAEVERTATEHAGVKIYPITFKGEPHWSVQSEDNRTNGKVLGDTIHATLEGAKQSAEEQVRRVKSKQERNAAYEAEQAAAQAKKDANKGKSLADRKRDFDLDKPTKLPVQDGLGTGTRRESMQKAVDQDRHIASVMVEDTAAKKKDKATLELVRARGYILGASNENIPLVKQGLEAQARLKANKYEKPEYRVYSGRDDSGSFYEISKTEYDYAQELKEKQATRETITPADDKNIGVNLDGNQLYERKDGSVYQMQDGKPRFSGFLEPVSASKEAVAPAEPAPVATESVAKPSRQYHLVAVNEKTGEKTTLNRTPVSHSEAVTMKGKYDDKPGRRIQLEDVTPTESESNPLDYTPDGTPKGAAIHRYNLDQESEAPVTAKQEYALPEKGAHEDWRGDKSDDFKPNPRQQLVMDATKQALDEGLFYNRQVERRVAELLGVSKETLDVNTEKVEGGNFGYDVYHARQAVEAQAEHATSKALAKDMTLKPGDSLGTIVTQDGKKSTSVVVETVSESGRSVTISGKRGVATIKGTLGVDAIKNAIEKAHKNGTRKTGYADFLASRATTQEPASNPLDALTDAQTQSADAPLPDNWRSGTNQATNRPTLSYNPQSGAHWATVHNVIGNAYEIEYRKGQSVVESVEVTGSRNDVIRQVQERVAELSGTPIHQDPGKAPEAATPPVIAQSLAKAARKEDHTQKEMRLWLVGEIDKAVKLTEDYADYQESIKKNGQDIADSIFFGKHSSSVGLTTPQGNGTITFDVPGDGKFKIRNSLRGLMEFRAKVEAKSGTGFTDKTTKAKGLPASTGVAKGSSNQIEALSSMLEELDFEAAVDYARETGTSLDAVKISPEVRKQFETYLKDGTEPQQFSPSRYWEYPGQDGADKDGNPIRKATLTKQIGASEYVALVVGTNATGFKYNITKDGKSVHAMLTSNSFANALKLAEDAINAIQPEVVKPKDTGWNMAGVGFAGKRYRGRNITLDDGREVVARIYENAGQYEDAEVKVDGVSKFRKTDRYKAEKLADDFIRTLTAVNKTQDDFERAKAEEQNQDDHLPKGWKKDGAYYEFRSASGSKFTPTQIAEVVGGTVTKQGMYSIIGVPVNGWEAAKRKLKDAGMWIERSEVAQKEDDSNLKLMILDALNRMGVAPTVADGYVRLYRAEPSNPKDRVKNGDMAGRFWSKDYSVTQAYGDRVYYKDVPKESVKGDGSEVFLSKGDAGEMGAKLLEPGFYDVGFNVFGAMEEGDYTSAIDLFKAESGIVDIKNDEPIPAVTESQARKQFEWRNMGQKDGTKSHLLFFFESEKDKGTGAAMNRGEVSLYPGASGWKVEDGDGTSYKSLADAKKAAIDRAIPILQDQGYILKPAQAATAILDAANVTGKERIDALKDVKKGDITPEELQAAYPAKEDKFPSTAQGAIDAFNADDSAQAVAIMAKLKLDDLKEVGGAIGFRPQNGENAKSFRERIGTVADKLTLTNRKQTSNEMKLHTRLTQLASDYDRAIAHRDRAIANGAEAGSSAFEGQYEGQWTTIDKGLEILENALREEAKSPDYAKVSAMVKEARPAIFDAAKPDNSVKPEAGGMQFSRSNTQNTGLTPAQFTAELAKAFGAKVADRLQAKGVVVPLADQSKLPAHVVPFLRDGDIIYGFYDPKTDRTYAVLENLTPEMVKGLVLHEVGVHFGFKSMLGEAKYNSVMKRLDFMRRAGNKAVKEAYAEAQKNSVRDSQVPEEQLAYLVQNAPEMGIVKEIIARIKAFLFSEFGIGGKYLTEADLTMLARAAVDHSSRVEDGGSVVPAFMRGTSEAVTNTNDVVGNQGGRSADDSTPGAAKQSLREWFGASKVVDENGNPKPVYHGTTAEFTEFDRNARGTNTQARGAERGFFFAGDKADSNLYVEIAQERARNSYEDNTVPKGRIIKAYLKAENPLVLTPFEEANVDQDIVEDLIDNDPGALDYAKDNGYDAVIWPHGNINNSAYTAVVFDPDQIREDQPNESTAPDSGGALARGVDQTGAEANPDIRFSRTTVADGLQDGTNNPRSIVNSTVEHLNARFNAPGTLNWWHKSFGTQYNLAERSAPFKRVFDSVQNFINDTSFYATEAASLAPKMIPKLETWKDIFRKPIASADSKAIAAPIFEGTLTWARDESGALVKMAKLEADAKLMTVDQKSQRLLRQDHVTEQTLRMWRGLPVEQYEAIINGKYERDMLKAGVVFTDSELKQQFNLTPAQISLYREFRAATDKSLTDLTISHMLKLGGKDTQPIADTVLGLDSVEASRVLADYLRSLAAEDDARSEVLMDTADRIIGMSDKATDLIARGYAPLSRFGQYTVDVISGGERVYFGMFESKLEANKMADKMKVNYPESSIQQGTVSQEEYKLFAGVTPETLELFGDLLGLDSQGSDAKNVAFQEYLKAAKSNRSAMKRLIQRKGIAGFSEDAGRVLAGFIYSNARQTSSNLHAGEITQATADIPKGQGEVKDAAIKLATYVQNPQEEAQAIRGLMFAQYIGGSVASAMVNLTQPFTMTLPWLSQYGGITKAAKQMAAATKDALKAKTGDARLDAALHQAEENGIVSPQEVHQLQGQASGRGSLKSGDGTKLGDAQAFASNSLSRVQLAWGKLFGVAEQFNRRSTFIAAYRTAVEQGIADPAGFAAKAIAETQGVYNKGNKPAWARGAIGSTLFTFKQFSISYMEMIHRMALGPNATAETRMAALYAMGILLLFAGVGGLPGADDLDDLISGLLQTMGYNFDSKAARRAFLVKALGAGGQRFVEHGLSGLPGVPVDVSGRLGLGNLVPGSGLLTKKTDHTRDVVELLGPVGDIAKRGFEASGQVLKGDIGGAAVTASPLAARNLAKAYDMEKMGMYRDQSGKKVIDTDTTEAVFKAIGFQPNTVKQVQDASGEAIRTIGLNKMRETEIANKWAQGMFEKDKEKVQDARDELAQWNRDNPDMPIRIDYRQIFKRLKEMNLTKEQRIAKTAPKEIRATVARELAESR